MSRPGRKAKEDRVARATARIEARKTRSAADQLALLDQRPGSSARERARLEKVTA